ncbi:MAG: TolC family protein [Ignavibacteriales bacterium]|nr:TolC family protein [Ignavibacteriales bacterium]
MNAALRNLAFPVVFLGFFSSHAVGQAPINPDSALQVILNELEGTLLSLRQAEQLSLRNATSLRRAEAAYLAAEGGVRRELGFYDPEVFFRLDYLDQVQPTASFFAGATVLSVEQASSRAGVRMNLPIGTQMELALNANRPKTNSAFALLNPEYSVFGSLSFRQPLLGGFSTSSRKQLTRAERTVEAEKARYDQQTVTVSAEVEHLYWDLYAACRDYAVQKLIRDRSVVFLKETELRVHTGLVGPSQVANARTFLAEQELLLLERHEQMDHQSDRLASLIGARPERGMSRFIPVDDPPGEIPIEPVDVVVERARNENLGLLASQKEVESVQVLADAAGWELLPRLDLVGSLGGTGLTGAGRDVIFGGDTLRTNRTGSFSDALNQVTNRDYPSWSVGLELSIPIGFRSGLGEKDRMDAHVSIARQRYLEQARLLEELVRGAHRELAHGQERIKAAREGVEAAQEQARIGLVEFRNGRTTAFEIVRLGEDFARAQQRYSQALVRTAKAAATLRQLTSIEHSSARN